MESTTGRDTHVSAAALGAVTITGQIVLMREIMVLFYGNELSAGISLLAWLLWTAAGGFLGTALIRGHTVRERALPPLLLTISALLPVTVVACRIAKTVAGFSQGEIIGIVPMTALAGIALFPFCFVSGLFFPILIGSVPAKHKADVDAPARLYLLESVGSSAFGLITALVLIRYLDGLTISFIMAALVGLTALSLSVAAGRRVLIGLSVPVVFAFVLLAVLPYPDVGAMTRRLQWKDFTVLASADTVYGNLTVTRAGGEVTFFDSGILSFSYPDLMRTEQEVIYPLLLHPAPRRVLLVGGGISSTLTQILKHPSIKRVDYVELDPALIDLGRRYLPPPAIGVLSDPRVRVIHTDGRLFVRRSHDFYDVIIVNVSDPVNARINRYFTREFFGEARRVLAPGGVFSISAASSDDIISPALASFLAGVFRTLKAVFPHTAVVPGSTAYFVGSDLPDRVDIRPAPLIARMKERGIVNAYVTEPFLLYQLSRERIDYVRRTIEAARTPHVNTDLSPTVYYYDMVLRSYWLSPGAKIKLADLAGSKPALPAAALVLVTILYGAFLAVSMRTVRPPRAARLVPAALASGFSEIALTVVIIIAFQTFYGYVYFSLGLIVSAFMVGLALGTAAARAWITRVRRPWRALIVIQVLYAIFCLVIVGVLITLSAHGSSSLRGLNLVFSFLNMFCGALAAFHYVTAVRSLTSSGAAPRAGGWVYATNLAGAAAGALLSSVVMIPLWGLVTTLLLVCGVNLCAAAVVGVGIVTAGGTDASKAVRGNN